MSCIVTVSGWQSDCVSELLPPLVPRPAGLSAGVVAMLDECDRDEVSFFEVLSYLDLLPEVPGTRPTVAAIDAAFEVIYRLGRLGLVHAGRTTKVYRGDDPEIDAELNRRIEPAEYLIRFVPEPLADVRDRVRQMVSGADADDWAWHFACWVTTIRAQRATSAD